MFNDASQSTEREQNRSEQLMPICDCSSLEMLQKCTRFRYTQRGKM